VPSGLRDLDSVQVNIREDFFTVSAIEFRGRKFIHWFLKVDYFYHALPMLSEWRKSSEGRVELDIAKGIKIAWRNIHYQATKIHPNQYLWTDIMFKYREDFDDDFDLGVFAKAEQRQQEEEDKHNDKREKVAADKERAKAVAKELANTAMKIRARIRLAYNCSDPKAREDVMDWGDFYMLSQD